MPRRLSDSVEEPIQVLISSKQQEFSAVRDELQKLIPKILIGPKVMLKVVLPENSHRIHITTEVDKLLRDSSIIVVLVGWDHSWWVDYEVDYAILNGIPVLAYEYYKPRGRMRGTTGRQTPTGRLVRRIMEADIKIRGRGGEYRSEDDLISAVIDDLPQLTTRIVNHYASINRKVAERV